MLFHFSQRYKSNHFSSKTDAAKKNMGSKEILCDI
jgi:hypothetical protein